MAAVNGDLRWFKGLSPFAEGWPAGAASQWFPHPVGRAENRRGHRGGQPRATRSVGRGDEAGLPDAAALRLQHGGAVFVAGAMRALLVHVLPPCGGWVRDYRRSARGGVCVHLFLICKNNFHEKVSFILLIFTPM